MKKFKKLFLWIGSSLLAIGIVVYILILSINGFDMKRVYNIKEVNKTYELGDFNNIDIDLVESDVKIQKSTDGINTISVKETDKIMHKIEVKNDVLKVSRKSTLFPINLAGNIDIDMDITISLNDKLYNSLEIDIVSGSLEIDGIRVNDAEIDNVSRSIDIKNSDMNVLELNNVSGKTSLDNVTSYNIDASTVSGSLNFENVISNNVFDMNSISGKIFANNSDGKLIKIQTVSGNVDLVLMTGKTFTYNTISGNVVIPNNTSNGETCNIKTVSGNINIKIA